MSAGLLERVHFRELAERGATVSGSVPLTSCSRLREVAEGESAEIVASLTFTQHESGVPLVSGELDVKFWMSCQRCLDRVAIRVRTQVKLAVVADETQLVPDAFEVFIAPDGAGRLADLLEEEILLALPEYPVHGSAKECGELAARVLELEQAPREPSAFDVLRKLKTDRN